MSTVFSGEFHYRVVQYFDGLQQGCFVRIFIFGSKV